MDQKPPNGFASRTPVPFDPARPSLAGFPDHLLSLIFEHLAEDDLIRVSMVCLYFYEQARYVQHRVIRIVLYHGDREYVKDRLDMVTRRGWLPAVRVLEVSGNLRSKGVDDDEEAKEIMGQLSLLVPGMTELRHLHWRVRNNWATVAIPPRVLGSLTARTRLHVLLYYGAEVGSGVAARDFLVRLKNNQNLQTVAYDVPYFHDRENIPKAMQALKQVLLSCPNLTRLYYQCADPSCIDPRRCLRPDRSIGLDVVQGEIPAALEEISLGSCDWGNRFRPEDREDPGARSRLEHVHWSERWDWSRVTTLHHADEVAAQYLIPKMVNLTRLELGDPNSGRPEGFVRSDAQGVLAQVCSPLEVLSFTDHLGTGCSSHGTHPLRMAAAKFGASLRELRVHHADVCASASYGKPSDLLKLGAGLPRLETLELDAKMEDLVGRCCLVHHPPWADYLDAIAAGFASLRTLELWAVRPNMFHMPALAVGSARRTLARLRERNRRIQRLVVHYGTRHGPSYHNRIDRHHFIRLECTVAYKKNCVDDDDNNSSYIQVTSPDLGSAQNRRLDELARLAGGDDDHPTWDGDVAGLDELGMLLKATMDEGPQVRRDWEKWRAHLPPWRQEQGFVHRLPYNQECSVTGEGYQRDDWRRRWRSQWAVSA